ncbi:MAG: hypothetical protein QM756_42575 [Polyangiaceae bacterium]
MRLAYCALCLTVASCGGNAEVNAPEGCRVEDMALAAALAKSGKALGELTTLSVEGASSLKGLECATALSKLSATSSPLTDLSPLAGLAKLRELDVSQTQIAKLWDGDAPALSVLRADGTQLSSLQGLQRFTSLSIFRRPTPRWRASSH